MNMSTIKSYLEKLNKKSKQIKVDLKQLKIVSTLFTLICLTSLMANCSGGKYVVIKSKRSMPKCDPIVNKFVFAAHEGRLVSPDAKQFKEILKCVEYLQASYQ